MLNEMMLIRRTLRELRISTSTRHPDIAPLAKSSPLLRVFLDANGHVASVEVVPQEDAPSYWTFRDGKQNSFPRVSFKPALRPGATADQLEMVSNRRKGVEQLRKAYLALIETLPLNTAAVTPWITAGHRQRIAERGKAVAASASEAAKVFVDLVNAFLLTNDADLLTEIENAVVAKLHESPSEDLVALACRLSFRDGGKSEKPSDACDVLFDFRDTQTLASAAEPEMSAILSEALPSKSQGEPNGICALTGLPARIEDDKFPEADFPVLGPTALHTRNPDLPSAHRYRVAGPASMPIGSGIASELQAAVGELTKPERKGKTWESVPSEKPEQSDLLICYLDGWPELNLAETITDSNAGFLNKDGGTAINEASFEKLGERIAALTKGKSTHIPPTARIQITVIRRIDKANKKTVHSCSLTRQGLEDAAREWTAACANVPEVDLFVPQKKGEAALKIPRRTLSPGMIVALCKKLYMTGGTKSVESAGLSFSDAFSLVMNGPRNSEAKIRSVLGFVLARFTPLLIGIGHVRSRMIKSSSKPDMEAFNPKARKDVLDAISLVGALLYQLNIKITKDMNTPAYELGQLLAGADILHRGYCLDVRGGKLPPKLIGNATMNTAAANPIAALAQLQQRWGPYEGWAKKRLAETWAKKRPAETNDDDSREPHKGDEQMRRAVEDAVYIPRKLEEIAARLAAPDSFRKPNDEFRAQLFLGYLAGLPRQMSKTSSTQDNKQ